MAPLSSYIENILGNIFAFARGHDAKLARASGDISSIAPIVVINSLELGDTSPGRFQAGKHEFLGENKFPQLAWSVAQDVGEKVRSWILIVEDADAPLPSPIVHGIYYDIPGTTRKLSAEDFVVEKEDEGILHGGFKYGANRRGSIWTGPRPVLGHGEHRYFFQLIGVNLESLSVSERKISKQELFTDGILAGKVVCWGEYMATFERTL